MAEKLLTLFHTKYHLNPDNDCWEWQTNSRNKKGYGRFCINRKVFYAHRISWEFHFYKIPDNLCVLHKCDNPPCVNPNHLFLGTLADNIHDMNKKNRQSFGSKYKDKVVMIRNSALSNRELGNLLNIDRRHIGAIRRGIHWKDITE